MVPSKQVRAMWKGRITPTRERRIPGETRGGTHKEERRYLGRED